MEGSVRVTGTARDPAYVMLRSRGLRQRLRDGGEMERLRAAIAIVKLEMARMRGEWSPDDPSEWDGVEEGKHLEVICEPTPAAREAQAKEPPFRHHETPFGQPKPSRPKFAEEDVRPEPHPQFHQVKFAAPPSARRRRGHRQRGKSRHHYPQLRGLRRAFSGRGRDVLQPVSAPRCFRVDGHHL